MVLTMCTDNSTSGTADTTSTGIALEGKVLTQNGVGVSNVMAKIANSNFNDLTDESGSYSITVSPDSLVTAGVDINTLSDTVQIIHENSLVKSLNIIDWQDTLPDVFLVQRSISGTLLGDVSSIVRIEAVLHNLTDTTTAPQISNLWFNPLVSSYNSFIYFKNEPVATQYSIYIRVYTSENIVSGMSPLLTFPSSAGDIQISPFDVNNVNSDIITLNNVVVSLSDTAHLSATITDNTSPIIKYEWDIGNMGNYVESPGPATTFVAPDSTRSIVYILKVTDADGGVFQNSSILTVIEDAPQVTITTIDSIASINDSLHFAAHSTDFYGDVVKYEWDVGNTGVFIDGPLDGTFVGMSPSFITDSLITLVRITDDDGIVTTNFLTTKVIEDTPLAIITPTTTSFPIKDSVELVGTLSSDSLGTIVSYEWKLGYGEWFKGNAFQSISTPQSIDTIFVVSLRVTDDDGNMALTSINLNLHGDTITDIRDGQRYAIETKDNYIWMAEDLNHSSSIIGDSLGLSAFYTKSDNFFYFKSIAPQNEFCPTGWTLPEQAKWRNIRDQYKDLKGSTFYFPIRCVTKAKLVPSNSDQLPPEPTILIRTNIVSDGNFNGAQSIYYVFVPYLTDNAYVTSITWSSYVVSDPDFFTNLIDTTEIHSNIPGTRISIINIPQNLPENSDADLAPYSQLMKDYITYLTINITDNLNRKWTKSVEYTHYCWWRGPSACYDENDWTQGKYYYLSESLLN